MFGEFEKRFLSSLIAGGTALVLAPSAVGQTNLIQNSQFTTTGAISSPVAAATSSGGQLANPGTYAANNSGNIYASSWTVSGINNSGESYLFIGNPNGETLNQGGGSTFSLYNNTVPITAPPGGGNVIGMDGGAGYASILSQTISGLMAGSTYSLTFEYAGAEQTGFYGATSAGWAVNLGTANAYGASISSTYTGGSGYQVTAQATNALAITPTLTITNNSSNQGEFTGWFTNTMYFTATNSSEVLSFLADGTPSGEPPFSLLADVSLTLVPEPSTIFATALLLIPIGASVVRRWRNRATSAE